MHAPKEFFCIRRLRNVLKVTNRELRADFDVEKFEQVTIWDAEREWIEMRLRSVDGQVVTVGDLGLTVSFDAPPARITVTTCCQAATAGRQP